MKSNKLFLILLSLVLSVTLLVACTQDEKPADSESDTTYASENTGLPLIKNSRSMGVDLATTG